MSRASSAGCRHGFGGRYFRAHGIEGSKYVDLYRRPSAPWLMSSGGVEEGYSRMAGRGNWWVARSAAIFALVGGFFRMLRSSSFIASLFGICGFESVSERPKS